MSESTASVPNRRDFVAALAVLAGASATPMLAQEVKAPDAKAYAEALDVVIRYRFGRFLTEEQLKRVHASALRGRFNADAMKKVDLANSDDPIEAFRADVP